LAKTAGVPYHAARQYARVAARIPPESPLRAAGLPYSILRLLAPLADPQPWAEQAQALQDAGKLHYREVARLPDDAGLPRPRPSAAFWSLCHAPASPAASATPLTPAVRSPRAAAAPHRPPDPEAGRRATAVRGAPQRQRERGWLMVDG